MIKRAVAFIGAVALVAIVSPAIEPERAAAASETLTLVTMQSTPHDSIGDGVARAFYPGNAEFKVRGSGGPVLLDVTGASGESFSFDFSDKRAGALTEGLYANARDTGRTHHPTISIFGNGSACSAAGRFLVKDIEYDGDVPTRFWILYEQRCDGGFDALVGEIRYNEPDDGGALAVGPWSERWPNVDRFYPALVAPFSVLNATDTTEQLGSAALSPTSSVAFTITSNECDGNELEPGEMCFVWVHFSTEGKTRDHDGTLILREPDGFEHRIPLHAYVIPGTTRFEVDGSPNDPITHGRKRTLTFRNSVIGASGTHKELFAGVGYNGGDDVRLHLALLRGRLEAGHTYTTGKHVQLDVSGNGFGCEDDESHGGFTLKDAVFDEHGDIRRFDLTFHRFCEDGNSRVRGEILWRMLR